MFKNLIRFIRHPFSRSMGWIFACLSLSFATWVVQIPAIKEKFGYSEAELGWLLFSIPIGLLLMNAISGRLIGKFGLRECMTAALLLLPTTLAGVWFAQSTWMLVLALFWMGMVDALLNVSMNTMATEVGKHISSNILSTCHGMWSLGGVVGSLIGAWFLGMDIDNGYHVLLMMGFIWTLAFVALRALRSMPLPPPSDEKSGLIMPNAYLMTLIVIGAIVAMAEGMAFDWSGVYLLDYLGSTAAVAAFGFGMFTLAMTVARFVGDALIERYSPFQLLFSGSLLGVVGIVCMLIFRTPIAGLIGFSALGLGCALGAPVLYGMSMKLEGIQPASGLATFATFSFAGFLLGPPIIGFIAHDFSLHLGVAFVGFLLLLNAFLAFRLREGRS